MVTILENLVVMVTIRASCRLHTPMYFFLANLSVPETLYTSVTIPKLLAGLSASARTISFSGCLTQLFLFLSLGSSECFLLATMACDRYLAICQNPCTTQPSWTRGSACTWPSVPGWVAS